MLTRCPKCETTFRVTPEQLKARQGKVRCGECQEVFNALDTLIEAAPAVVAASPGTIDAPRTERKFEPEAPAPTEEARLGDEVSFIGDAAAANASVPEPEPEPEPEPPAHAADAEPPSADDWLPATEAPKRRRWPWVLGSAATALVLAFQILMHYRSEIVVLQPDMAPAVAGACEILGCEMRLPRKVELMSIETSDLHPEADGKLTLTATLKNRAPFAQEHAHLELTLTDTADKALVRRVLPPTEYLPAADGATGITPGQELPVELSIDAPGVPAAGYRLYLFYP